MVTRKAESERGRRSLGRGKSNDEVELPQNDDEEEQKRRQRERILEQQRINLNSPLSTPQERPGVAGLSNAQLAEHYTDCIRLSTENKITVKNAFGLHLIDYMSEMIKSKEGATNFQMASCTLDASTKIYASRVDCIHAETLKMAGGLGMVDDQKKRKEKLEDDAASNSGEDEPKKKKRMKKGTTIERNLKNITINPSDLEYEMDPLFQKMTLMYEEGGVCGLLTNNLMYANDCCELLLDPTVFPPPLDQELRKVTAELKSRCDISKFKDSLTLIKDRTICPSLSTFSFTNDKDDLEVDFRFTPDDDSQTDFAYDPTNLGEPGRPSSDLDDDDGDAGAPMMDDDTLNENVTGLSEREFRAGCVAARTPGNKPVSLSMESYSEMASMLAEQPSEYSYFDQNLVATWAGPTHWKIKPFSKTKEVEAADTSKPNRKRVKKVVEKLVINQTSELVIEPSNKCLLNKPALQRWSSEKITLPEDLHYDCQNLRKFLIQPKGLKIKVASPSKAIDPEQDEKYDYNNVNDVENFVPSNHDDSSGDDGAGIDNDGADATQGNFSFTIPTQETQAGLSLGSQGLPGTSGLQAFTGDNLVQQPYKIEKFNIAFDRTAKKVDVLKVKKTMWSILSRTSNDDKDVAAEVMPSPMAFSELVSILPKHVSEMTAKNMSIPISLVTLLHIVNEKNLKITGRADLTDFVLEQD